MLLYSHALTLTSIHLLIFQFVLMFNWISWTNPTAKDYEIPPMGSRYWMADDQLYPHLYPHRLGLGVHPS